MLIYVIYIYTVSFSDGPRKKIQDTWCAEISLGVNAKIVDLEDLGHLGYPHFLKPRQVKLWRPARALLTPWNLSICPSLGDRCDSPFDLGGQDGQHQLNIALK